VAFELPLHLLVVAALLIANLLRRGDINAGRFVGHLVTQDADRDHLMAAQSAPDSSSRLTYR